MIEPKDWELETWIRSFSAHELRQNGWTHDLLLKNCAQNLFFAETTPELTALISYSRPAPDIVEILFLGTSPRWRHGGVMGKLLERFLAAEEGRRVWLECREDNLNARDLYLKKGFQEVGRRPHYYGDGSTAILFSL